MKQTAPVSDDGLKLSAWLPYRLFLVAAQVARPLERFYGETLLPAAAGPRSTGSPHSAARSRRGCWRGCQRPNASRSIPPSPGLREKARGSMPTAGAHCAMTPARHDSPPVRADRAALGRRRAGNGDAGRRDARAVVGRAAHGLSQAGWRILAVIAERDAANASEIGRACALDPFAVSRGIGQLVELGFAVRRSGRTDRRFAAVSDLKAVQDHPARLSLPYRGVLANIAAAGLGGEQR